VIKEAKKTDGRGWKEISDTLGVSLTLETMQEEKNKFFFFPSLFSRLDEQPLAVLKYTRTPLRM